MNLFKTYNRKTLSRLMIPVVLGLWSAPSYAYLDPGTGSLLIQEVIGAIAAVGVTLKLYWHKLRVMFSSKKTKNDTE